MILRDGAVVHAGRLAELDREGSRVVVAVDARSADLAALLRERGFDAVERVDEVSVGTADGVHDAVRDAVAELGVGLRRLGPERQTLEDVYMEVSGS